MELRFKHSVTFNKLPLDVIPRHTKNRDIFSLYTTIPYSNAFEIFSAEHNLFYGRMNGKYTKNSNGVFDLLTGEKIDKTIDFKYINQ